jgi:TPR repeat protein
MRSIFRSKRGRIGGVLAAGMTLAAALAWSAATPRDNLPDDPRQLQVLAGPGRQPAALDRLRTLAEGNTPLARRALGEALLGTRESATDAHAAFLLGKSLMDGTPGIPRDPARGAMWLGAAAEAGHAGAAFHLGIAHRNGYGVGRDAIKAARWFRVAAEQGIPAAQFMLANAYRTGDGVPRDEREALRLYTEAAEQDHPEAVQTLAMAYRDGELGLARDEMQARHFMLETAHALKHPALRP